MTGRSSAGQLGDALNAAAPAVQGGVKRIVEDSTLREIIGRTRDKSIRRRGGKMALEWEIRDDDWDCQYAILRPGRWITNDRRLLQRLAAGLLPE
jgi:hypothetical protein